MTLIDEIIDGFGGNAPFAVVCGFEKNLAARGGDMRRRKSIPISYWEDIRAEATEQGRTLTYEDLVNAHRNDSKSDG